ncbi:MAG: hypothetical protein KDB27_32735 [Planctomycetales bacterium]|nr:hypothetical protein [Planctomycetales bacterium]
MLRTFLALVASVFVTACPLVADDELNELIEDLAKVAEPGVGYSGYFSGSRFLPYGDSEQLGTFVFGGTYRSESDTLRKIVAKGPGAVPTLLEHLSDARRIAMEPLAGMMWMDFPDEYDFNRRTRTKPPPNVNRDMFDSNEKHPDSHAITIGDLCFVAIGQIVNRNYSATRYQPTGGLVVNSPTYSKRLRDALVADWSDLTAEKHRRLLIEDFEKPDHVARRIGAYWRLSFYYPDAVEPLVLRALEQPVFDVFKIAEFCRDNLYHAKAEDRKQLYDNFIRENGNHYSVGVMAQLFDDLATLEAHEERRISPPLTEYSTQPRELLIQLFDKSDSIKSTDRPQMTVMSESERARFIGSLTHDESKRIGEVVKQIYVQHTEDDYLAPACLNCLANRGYGEFLVDQLNQIDFASSEASHLHSEYLEAIATSKSVVVRERLLQVIRETANDTYFIHALAGLDNVQDAVVWDNATRILSGLPQDTEAGRGILALIANKFPDKAEELFKSFLATGSPKRAETMCVVLWYGHPLSPKILAPLLDDKRELSGFSIPLRVCDRAAQAISHTTEEIKFDSEWSQQMKDAAIVKLKEYCENRR